MPFLSTSSSITTLMSSLEDSRMYLAMCYVVTLGFRTSYTDIWDLSWVGMFPSFQVSSFLKLRKQKKTRKTSETKETKMPDYWCSLCFTSLSYPPPSYYHKNRVYHVPAFSPMAIWKTREFDRAGWHRLRYCILQLVRVARLTYISVFVNCHPSQHMIKPHRCSGMTPRYVVQRLKE